MSTETPLFGQEDLPSLSPFRYDRNAPVMTVKKVSKKGASYTMTNIGILPRDAAPDAGTFRVVLFKDLAARIRVLGALNPKAWLVATVPATKEGEDYSEMIVSIARQEGVA